jgi:signal transduction histidine kinase
MSFFTFTALLTFLTNASIALFLFIKSDKRKEVHAYGRMCIFVSVWGFGSFIGSLTKSEELSKLGYHIAMNGVILIPVAFYGFVTAYTEVRQPLLYKAIILTAVIFLVSNIFFHNIFFSDVYFAFNQFYYMRWNRCETLYLVLYILFYWILLIYSFSFLIIKFIQSTGLERNRLKYIVFGTGLGWLGGHNDFIAVFRPGIYPLLNILVGVYPLIIGYAIIKHKVLDINIVIKRSLVYSILLAIVSITYLIIVVIIEYFIKGLVGYKSIIFSVLIAFFVGLILVPLRNRIQSFVDKRLFKATTPQLAELNEKLTLEVAQTEKFKAIATLASGMAHEIKNPLTAIKTFTEYFPQYRDDPDFLRRYSKIVGKEVDRIDDLIHQLLKFSKPTLSLTPTNIVQLIDNTLTFLDNDFVKRNIKLVKQYETNKILTKIDDSQIRQAFLNILLNAIDAINNDGTLTVTISVIQKDNNKRTFPDNHTTNEILISVKDSGHGIKSEDIKHIFEPFYTNKDNGTGLGLAITYGIINEHRGKIEVLSDAGCGAEFRITLPIIS